jgi:hypothetical protein
VVCLVNEKGKSLRIGARCICSAILAQASACSSTQWAFFHTHPQQENSRLLGSSKEKFAKQKLRMKKKGVFFFFFFFSLFYPVKVSSIAMKWNLQCNLDWKTKDLNKCTLQKTDQKTLNQNCLLA